MKIKKVLKFILALLAVLIVFYLILRLKLYREEKNLDHPLKCYNEIDPALTKIDVQSKINIKSKEDAEKVRKDLIKYVWKEKGFPKNSPKKITENVESPINNLPNLKQINKLEIEMESDFKSYVFHFIPQKENRRIVIFHHGHSDELGSYGGEITIRALLENGFSVLAFYMPLFGPNPKPVSTHDEMVKYNSTSLSFIKFFLEPVAVSVNFLKEKYNYKNISMMGISGGGWTTTFYSAIDPTIETSINISGTVPLYMQEGPCGEGLQDAEQIDQGWTNISDYLDLFILSSFGNNRKYMQVINKYDTCCSYGIRYKTYENLVTDAVSNLKEGEFQIFEDRTLREHTISPYALKTAILPYLSGNYIVPKQYILPSFLSPFKDLFSAYFPSIF